MLALFDLSGKAALVTGGSRALGLAIARGLASAGARVAIAARHPPAEPPGFDCAFLPADLVRPEQRRGLVDAAAERLGALDILFHGAGQQCRHPAESFPPEDWQAVLELHLTAAMDLAQQAARHMLPRRRGKIVLMSSLLAFQGGLYIAAYAAAKHGVSGLVKALANEWGGRGINVNALAPGYFDAGVGQAVVRDPVRGPQILARIPAGRPGVPDDLIGAAIFLASAASDYVHGHTLVVDGGWMGR
jgi:2-deoxy-D-gluconate 3-dehydrogenase